MEYDERKELEALLHPLVEWLNGPRRHPHLTIHVTAIGAELVEGVETFQITEYLRD